METMLNLLVSTGLVGSLALLAWGLVLCVTQRAPATPQPAATGWTGPNLPAGTTL